MSVKVKDIMGVMEQIAPKHLAEGWDNVGLAIGDPERKVTKVLVALDVIDPVVEEAKEIGAEMIVTTEKDAVRIPRLLREDIPFYFLRVEIDILSGQENFDQCIRRICFI